VKINQFKKLTLLALLIIIALLSVGCVKKSTEKASKPPIKLSTNPLNPAIIEIFNKYADSEDIIGVRPEKIDILNSFKTGKPMLVFGKRDDPEEMIDLAKQKGIKTIGYNYENSRITKEELLEQQIKVYQLTKENGLKYVFGPLAIHVVRYGAELAENTDAIMIQLRNFQLQDDFEKEVESLITEMKRVNPEIEIWVQIDVTPNLPKDSEKAQPTQVKQTTEELLRQIEAIEDQVDVVSIWYDRDELEVTEEIFKEMRNSRPSEI
jgi:hypothetical protein